MGFSPVAVTGEPALLGVHWLLTARLFLFRGTGSRALQLQLAAVHGLRTCGSWTRQHRLNSCSSQA